MYVIDIHVLRCTHIVYVWSTFLSTTDIEFACFKTGPYRTTSEDHSA